MRGLCTSLFNDNVLWLTSCSCIHHSYLPSVFAMGNCFGKESGGNFSGEGHTIGGSQTQTTPQAPRPLQSQAQPPVKSKPPPRVGGPGHTLGSAGTEEDARTAAARAAEVSSSALHSTQATDSDNDYRHEQINHKAQAHWQLNSPPRKRQECRAR